MNKFIILFLLLIPIAVYATPISPINPSGTTLPATCRTGSLFIDTDADTDGALYQCAETDTWKVVGSISGTYQPLESTLTDIADGIIAENLVNTAYPWADNEVADNLSLSLLKLTALAAEPTEVVGEIYLADHTTWDPCGLDGTDPYYVICTAADTFVVLFDVAGNFYFSTIQAAMKVIPDADGITLTASQMNAVIVATNASEVQIPADQCDTVTGKWITVKQTGAYAVDIAVLDAADDIYMTDGTKIEGTTHEIQTAGASGNQITLMCIAVNEWWVTGEIGTSTSEAAD